MPLVGEWGPDSFGSMPVKHHVFKPWEDPGESPDLSLGSGPPQSSQGPGCGDPSGPALNSVQHWTVLLAWHICTWNWSWGGWTCQPDPPPSWAGGWLCREHSPGPRGIRACPALPLGEMFTTYSAPQIRQRSICKMSSQGQDEMTHETSGLTGG